MNRFQMPERAEPRGITLGWVRVQRDSCEHCGGVGFTMTTERIEGAFWVSVQECPHCVTYLRR